MLGRSILRPLERLAGAMRQVEKGDYSEQSLPPARDDEIGRLVAHFRTMRQSVQESRHSLEEKVRERTEALDHLTKTDPLTELLNRRGMTERLEAEISRAGRNNSRFGIVWLDLDRFKDINDQHGHKRGDEALIKVSRLIRSIIRPYDSAARWGGDEFLMLLQQCDGPALELLSERIRAAVATSCHVDGHDGIPVPFSISAGTYLYDDGDDLETILLRADLALYEAKEGGRNRVSHYRQRGPVRLQSR
ncbi:GGDEF domain-containing protein [Marinobacterium aestuariivivens]|uniref:diguanylate cyclase n=1 Tax=Marinobacterium aestuariivivens TaxID=1698799 RepID=A0ABW2A6V3_9GAMM